MADTGNTSSIRERMEVVGSDGQHVGTVDHVEGGRIKLTRNDPAAGGEHHYIQSDQVRSVGSRVELHGSADEVRRSWQSDDPQLGMR